VASQRFQDAGADTVLLVGPSGANWPTALQTDPSYRPKLLFLDRLAGVSFSTNAATTDLSILDGSLAGGGYGPDQARFDEPEMQACIGVLTKAGLETPPPSASTSASDQPYQAAFQACPDVALLKAWITAAGDGPELRHPWRQDGLEVAVRATRRRAPSAAAGRRRQASAQPLPVGHHHARVRPEERLIDSALTDGQPIDAPRPEDARDRPSRSPAG
jgi:hypothetical protein